MPEKVQNFPIPSNSNTYRSRPSWLDRTSSTGAHSTHCSTASPHGVVRPFFVFGWSIPANPAEYPHGWCLTASESAPGPTSTKTRWPTQNRCHLKSITPQITKTHACGRPSSDSLRPWGDATTETRASASSRRDCWERGENGTPIRTPNGLRPRQFNQR